jgi:endonuclease-8
MPEGDTIHRTARTLSRWISGRVVDSATCNITSVGVERLIGETVALVEARAKHLLIHVAPSGLVLHTHMRMTGSWHVYELGATWQKPRWQAKIELGCDGHVAVGFNVPVIEILRPVDLSHHNVLSQLGPDLLGVEPIDFNEAVHRARTFGQGKAIGIVLLDQRVVGGIGNIWRAESLFLCGINPSTSIDQLNDSQVASVVETAQQSMAASVSQRNDGLRRFGESAAGQPWVYNRSGKPCRRCGAIVQSALLGEQARRAYWCPECQPSSA